jgi:hypothetical protein
MTLLQFTMLKFSNTTVSNTSKCLGKTLVETNQPEWDRADALFTEKNFWLRPKFPKLQNKCCIYNTTI